MAQSQARANSGTGRLKDRIALVTGSSSGIGRGIAIAFAHEGADLVINYPDDSQAANAKAVAAEVERLGRRAVVVRADVSVEDAARSLVDATINSFQRVDILVNNAGIASAARVEDMPVAMWDRMMAVNLRSVFLCTHFVLPIMYRQNYGKIISTASQLAYRGYPQTAHYAAAKAAVITFTRSLALEIGKRNVNSNCVAPGATETPLLQSISREAIEAIRASIPKGRLATVDDIVPAYVFLASDESRHFVGQCISPNGGDVML
jgi:3-oxoacyl-[acyl-carrier protein] reductase